MPRSCRRPMSFTSRCSRRNPIHPLEASRLFLIGRKEPMPERPTPRSSSTLGLSKNWTGRVLSMGYIGNRRGSCIVIGWDSYPSEGRPFRSEGNEPVAWSGPQTEFIERTPGKIASVEASSNDAIEAVRLCAFTPPGLPLGWTSVSSWVFESVEEAWTEV